MSRKVLVNGAAVDQISVLDRGFNYGDGLFETILVLGRFPVFLDAHLQRLSRGCHRLQLTPPDAGTIRQEILQLASQIDRGVVKVIYTRGNSQRGFAIHPQALPTRVVQAFEQSVASDSEKGFCLRLCDLALSHQPRLAGLKHLNQLERVLARMEWSDPSIHEGLMCDGNGKVIEGTMSNVFVVKDGRIYTPDLSLCGVEGVIREQILNHADALECSVDVTALTVDDVRYADELFLTNSVMPVRPVTQFEDKSYSIGPVTGRVMGWMERHIELDLQSYNNE